MPKLQQIKRVDGSKVSSMNIPNEIIERTGWKKGDILSVESEEVSEGNFELTIKREGGIDDGYY